MLQERQTTTALDLAQLLKDEQGTFIGIQGTQAYLIESLRGHSIVSGPTPLGPPLSGVVQAKSLSAEPWTVTKISEETLSGRSYSREGDRSGFQEARR